MRKKHMNKHKPRKIKIRLLAIFMLLVLFMCLLTAVVVYTQANQQFEMLYSEINQGNLKAYSDALTLKLRPIFVKLCLPTILLIISKRRR